MTIKEKVIKSMQNLGGKASYSDLYCEYEKITQTILTSGQKAGIRKCIEDSSSDSKNFTGKEDLFYSVYGKGKGVWGLR